MSLVSDRSGASKRHIEDTKRLLSGLLTKQLDERQLARPSFEFIQDLVKTIINETRILRDVFNPKDFDLGLQSARRKPQSSQEIKKAKVEFVQKLINFAANNKQPVIGCVASKIIAGLEPNKTNELLQSLARVCQAKLSANSSNSLRNSSASDRPRTFTRQLDSGVASGKQLSSRKPSSETALSSAGSTKATFKNNGTNIKSKQQQPQPQPQPRVKKELNTVNNVEPTAIAAPLLSKQPEQQPVAANYHTNSPAKTTPVKEKPSRQRHITSESDIGKEIHHVKAHLKLIRTTLADVMKQEATLRDALFNSIQTTSSLG